MSQSERDLSEFIGTYSDDLAFLLEARSALLTHPLRNDYATPDPLDASMCRLFVVVMVGSIETMLATWRELDRGAILNTYFKEGVKNGDRVTNLYEAFRNAGIPVDKQVFDSYLAIKYLRNTIMHAQWRKHDEEWLLKCGFPTDSRKLTREHLTRITNVNQNMMLYIALTSHTTPQQRIPKETIKLDESVTQLRDEDGILRIRDLNRIIWNNLERISSRLHHAIEKAVIGGAYDWTAGRTDAELHELRDHDQKRMYFIAARKASEENSQLFAGHREQAQEALEFWREYSVRALASQGLSYPQIRIGLRVFEDSEFAALARTIPLTVFPELPEEIMLEVLHRVLGPKPRVTTDEILSAIRTGKIAYEAIPNITPVSLLTLYLPIVDPKNAETYLLEADHIIDAFRVGRAWYSWVEHRSPPNDDVFDFYRQMAVECSKPTATAS